MATVAFDVIGTLFSLDAPRRELAELGAPECTVDLWFAQSLRDYFSLSLSEHYVPMDKVLAAGLPRTLEMLGVEADEAAMQHAFDSLYRLQPTDGAAEACQIFIDNGWKVLALTNSSEHWTQTLLDQSGLGVNVHRVISCDDLGVSKPHKDVYAEAWEDAMMPLWMVAAHGWDIAGAAHARLNTVWIDSPEQVYLECFPEPMLVADSLEQAARELVDREQRRRQREVTR